MKNKLYSVDFKYDIVALEKRWILNKKYKPITIHRWVDDMLIICNLDNIENKVYEYIRQKHKKNETEIEEKGYTDIYNLDSNIFNCCDIRVNEIIQYKVTNIKYIEATLSQCIENLTPNQFVKLYGNLNLFNIKE